jgi:predicted metal-dependent hydrolase
VNVLHLLLPSGERFFCDALRLSLPYVTDDQLRADIKGFIGQEGIHARQHEHCIEHMASYGLDVRRPMAVAERARKALDRRVRALPEPLRRHAVIEMVAVTAAAEHVTAYLGAFVMEECNWDELDVDPEMRALLRWHGAEEVEHRHVAYDALQHMSGSWLRRVRPLPIVGLGLTLGWVALAAGLMRLDPTTKERWRWRQHQWASRDGRMKSIPRIAWDLRHYARRDHHPSQLPGSLERAVSYLATAVGQ